MDIPLSAILSRAIAWTTRPAVAPENHDPVPCSVYVATWATLVFWTMVTVGASYLELGNIATFVAMLIASVKASLVVLYFMHIRFTKPVFIWMILTAITTYAIFIGFMYSDYGFR